MPKPRKAIRVVDPTVQKEDPTLGLTRLEVSHLLNIMTDYMTQHVETYLEETIDATTNGVVTTESLLKKLLEFQTRAVGV